MKLQLQNIHKIPNDNICRAICPQVAATMALPANEKLNNFFIYLKAITSYSDDIWIPVITTRVSGSSTNVKKL